MPGRLVDFILFGVTPLVLASLLAPAAATAKEVTISGDVSYRERIALPPNAVLTVQLTDVSLADAPSTTIAEQKIDPAGQVPIKFELKVDSAVFQPKATYALQARITANDQLMFINDQRYTVDPRNIVPQSMLLKMVQQKSDAAAAPTLFDTVWLAEDIAGGGVIDSAQSTFSVTADGSVSGSGGCNRYFAKAEVNGNKISIGKPGSTMMACPPAQMEQEHKFLTTLEKAATFRIDAEQGRLFLVDANGVDILRFSAEVATTLFDTVWLAEDIAGGGVIDYAQSTFSVTADGKVSGSGGCNRYFAQAKVDGNKIGIGKAGATMMACSPAQMEQEHKFLTTLEKAATFRIDAEQGKLFLMDANGVDILRFAAEG